MSLFNIFNHHWRSTWSHFPFSILGILGQLQNHPWCESQLSVFPSSIQSWKAVQVGAFQLPQRGLLNFDFCSFAVVFLLLPLLPTCLHTLTLGSLLREAFPKVLPTRNPRVFISTPCLLPKVTLVLISLDESMSPLKPDGYNFQGMNASFFFFFFAFSSVLAQHLVQNRYSVNVCYFIDLCKNTKWAEDLCRNQNLFWLSLAVSHSTKIDWSPTISTGIGRWTDHKVPVSMGLTWWTLMNMNTLLWD